MHHRNREQCANRLHKDAPPFERAYVRAADQDALAARLGRRFQLRDNLGAVGWKMSAEQIRRLDEASARSAPYPYSAYYTEKSYATLNPPPV